MWVIGKIEILIEKIESVPGFWGIEGLQRRARPNLRHGNVFVGDIESLKIAGGASELYSIVAQAIVFGHGFSANRVTASIEMIETHGGIPEGEVTANLIGVLGHKFGNGILRMDSWVVSEKIDGKGQEVEMGLFGIGGDE